MGGGGCSPLPFFYYRKESAMRYQVKKLTGHDCEVFWLQIDPEDAKKLLDKSEGMNFRKLDSRRVSKYAVAMKSGHWTPRSGAIIILDTDGRLINGQHRLRAIIEAGVPVHSLVLVGADRLDDQNTDRGKPRLTSDYLAKEGHANATTLAAVLRLLWQLEMGIELGRGGADNSLDVPTAMALMKRHPHIAGFLKSQGNYGRLIPGTIVSFVAYVGWMESGMSLEAGMQAFYEFRDGLRFSTHNGVMLPERSPLAVLHKRTVKAKRAGVSLPRKSQIALSVMAWNAWIEGRSVGFLRWRSEGAKAQEFPTWVTKKELDGLYDDGELEDRFLFGLEE